MVFASFFLKTTSIAYWLWNSIISLIGACLSWCFYYYTVIISTSFVGAYLFVRGISLYTGGYPNEIDYIKQLSDEDPVLTPDSNWWYVFFTFILILTFLFSWFQFRNKRLDEEDEVESETKHPFEGR